MSYDIALCVKAGSPKKDEWGEDWNGFTAVWDANYTSNCAPMWRAAGVDFHDWEGRSADDFAPVLAAAIETLKANQERFEAMNPPNGWGSYKTLVPWLEVMLEAALRFDYAVVTVDS